MNAHSENSAVALPASGVRRSRFHFASAVFTLLIFCGFFIPPARADETAANNPPPVRTLTEADTLALLTATLQKNFVKDKGELELNFTQPWNPPVLPAGPLTVKILELPAAGVARAFIIRFQLCTTNQTVGTWETSLQAHIWRNVWVAHSELQRGELVIGADVVQERRDVLGVNEALAEFSPDDPSLQFANEIGSGNILLARNLKPRTVIHRGQMADALLQDGALNIMLKVEVLEDGAPGQIVRLRNPVSLRSLTGKVVNDQTVSISL